jgi:hypothetical protein
MNKEKKQRGIAQRADAAVMVGVNNGVRAWNWTTGRTKSDLANMMLTTALVSETAVIIADSPNVAAGVVMGSLILMVDGFFVHTRQKRNKETERLEEAALKGGMLDLEVEKHKFANKMAGQFFLGSSLMFSALSKGDTLYNALWMAKGGLMAPSFYVMRADSLPPRKSAFKRAREKISEMLRESQPQPAPSPAYGMAVENLVRQG